MARSSSEIEADLARTADNMRLVRKAAEALRVKAIAEPSEQLRLPQGDLSQVSGASGKPKG